jgi:CRISPR-associated protein Cas4
MYYDYISISKINDFVFCPHSIYFHNVYEGFEDSGYKSHYQTAGKLAHQKIDFQKYSSSRDVLQGIEVFSENFGIIGKIDLYDKKSKILTERKNKIKKIYDGYGFQLLAQKICLEEMGFPVEKMRFYSLSDNKEYLFENEPEAFKNFKKILVEMRSFNPLTSFKISNPEKCRKCIYRELCRKL